jgi:AcrR family transcriptional regulator
MSTREKILKVALEFFLNNTYREVSINDIVREAGITKGGHYHSLH